MSNIVQFIGKVKSGKPEPAFACSLSRVLLTVQYCALVLEDNATACEILQVLSTQPEPLSRIVTLPGRYREAVENTDTAATYRAVLGVVDDQ